MGGVMIGDLIAGGVMARDGEWEATSKNVQPRTAPRCRGGGGGGGSGGGGRLAPAQARQAASPGM